MAEESGPHRIGGVDYPRTLQEFNDWFSSEAACLAYLRRVRWRQSFRCPQCAGSEAWLTNTGHLKCRKCRRRTSLTAGTIFERTQKPLRVWFQAMWYLTSQKSGGSALGLHQVLGLGSCQTAWSWLHKLRRAMVRPGRDRLNGFVEVDETHAGGEEEGVRGRQTEEKAIVVVAASRTGGGSAESGSNGCPTSPARVCTASSKNRSPLGRWFTRTAGRAITTSPRRATLTRSRSSAKATTRRTN